MNKTLNILQRGVNQCVTEPSTKMRKKRVKKCKKYLHSRKDIVMLCGDKNDVIHCYQGGFLDCCYNNLPCLEKESTIKMFNDMLEDIQEAKFKRDFGHLSEESYSYD